MAILNILNEVNLTVEHVRDITLLEPKEHAIHWKVQIHSAETTEEYVGAVYDSNTVSCDVTC